MRTSTIIALFLGAMCSAAAQTLPDTIAFTLNSQSNICIRANINGADSMLLMFHSAYSGVSLTQKAIAKMSALKQLQDTKVNTWGGSADAQLSEGNQLSISRSQWENLTIFINENAGVGTDGKFGYDLFKGKIIEIDYNHKRFIVHPRMPRLAVGYRKMDLIEKQGSLFITGTLKLNKTQYRDTFMFHTGYGGAVLLDPKIGERYAMQAQLKTISTSELKDAYGNVFKIETKELPLMRLGHKRLKKVPLSFAARSSAIPMKVLGNGLLKRFNVVFDFQEQRVYLRPNGLS
jgi:hypothetical protein